MREACPKNILFVSFEKISFQVFEEVTNFTVTFVVSILQANLRVAGTLKDYGLNLSKAKKNNEEDVLK